MSAALKKRLLIGLLVIIYILTGFFREFIFLNINEQRRATYDLVYRHEPTESFVAPSMRWLSGMSYETLTNLKWPLTLVFTALFAFISTRVVKVAFGRPFLVRITWLTYAAVFLLGSLFYLIGWLTSDVESTYDIARFLAGLTETPALLAILCAAFLALGRVKSQSVEK